MGIEWTVSRDLLYDTGTSIYPMFCDKLYGKESGKEGTCLCVTESLQYSGKDEALYINHTSIKL